MVLFFYKAILLTPSPIALTQNWIEIVPSEPIGAITSDAALYVDITGIVKEFDFEKLEQAFPQNTIVAKLITKNKKEFLLSNKNAFSMSKKEICIIVSGLDPIPTNFEFVKVRIKSTINLNGVNIIWKNGSL